MSTLRLVTLMLLVLGTLAGCAEKEDELFVVLPNPDGTSGAITVSDGGNSVVLDRPYAAEDVKGDKVEQTTSDSAQVQQVFGSALAAQPILPEHFRLYFQRDKDVMTAESQQQYRNVFADIKRRPVYQVEVIGHTDTLGQQPYNQELSLKRAAALRDELVRDGLNPDSITIAGRGELDPAVPTGPQVAEPRNRRVEITVR
jgi:outer membrane protein OmpA-like peptidoglycan-associated protein